VCAPTDNTRARWSNDRAGVVVDTGGMSTPNAGGMGSLVLLACPDTSCGAVAEIVDRITLGSTDGPIDHVKTRCLDGDIFVLPASRAFRPVPAEELSETGRAG
jgi:hypothetical protein